MKTSIAILSTAVGASAVVLASSPVAAYNCEHPKLYAYSQYIYHKQQNSSYGTYQGAINHAGNLCKFKLQKKATKLINFKTTNCGVTFGLYGGEYAFKAWCYCSATPCTKSKKQFPGGPISEEYGPKPPPGKVGPSGPIFGPGGPRIGPAGPKFPSSRGR